MAGTDTKESPEHAVPYGLKEASLVAHRALMDWDAGDTAKAKKSAQLAHGHLTAVLEILGVFDRVKPEDERST